MAESKIPKIRAPFLQLSSGDMNDIKGTDVTGFYYVTTGVNNAPQEWSWYIIIGGGGTVQIGFTQNKIYLRAYTGYPLAWTEWKQLNIVS